MASEEDLISKLVQQGKKLNNDQKYEECSQVLKEAYNMSKWKELFGAAIIANLAFACAKKGDVVMARYYLDDLQNHYQEYGILDEDGISMVQEALLIADNQPEKDLSCLKEELMC
eukprot:CAMPEP_0202968954 /NCGR_PEP_ID=MMETSP1396-20130829/14495_1 /ASSEMBLY_ACC=CAM_ASM_000872 /TAXON_ID= /ORGANISM="Pseudokeronopsis sp., Strain Brazil" /LENGTH=114 /DNA_ID=CAMNT_0049695919 /DNA_START=468 /DNA_END=812 /DNA_ORIENTATION=+